MSDIETKKRALLTYVTEVGRVCPEPPKWNQLYRILDAASKRLGLDSPKAPLILSAWVYSTDSDKAERLREHIEIAVACEVFDQVDELLRSLPDDSWHQVSTV